MTEDKNNCNTIYNKPNTKFGSSHGLETINIDKYTEYLLETIKNIKIEKSKKYQTSRDTPGLNKSLKTFEAELKEINPYK